MLQRLKLINNDVVQSCTRESLQRNAFCLLPENFIYSLIRSEDVSLSVLGWKTVLRCRETLNISSGRKFPKINFDAQHWSSLISLDDENIQEPPCTTKYNINELKAFINDPTRVQLPDFPSHSQSVERSVKLVTMVSKLVYGLDRRHETIKAKIAASEIRPPFISKGHYSESYDKLF